MCPVFALVLGCMVMPHSPNSDVHEPAEDSGCSVGEELTPSIPQSAGFWEGMTAIHERCMLQQTRKSMPWVTMPELEAMTGRGWRTVLRYIEAMQTRFKMPVAFVKARGGYGYTEKVTQFPFAALSRGELLVVCAAFQSLEAYDNTPYYAKVRPLVRKLTAQLSQNLDVDLKHMRACLSFRAGGYQAPVDLEIFETIVRSTLNRELVEFDYRKLTRTADSTVSGPEHRRVEPLHVICWDHAWYLIANDPLRTDRRTFALGRMSDAVGTGMRFKPAKKFDIHKELEHSFGITRGGKPETVRLQFSKEVVPLVAERIWHGSQEMVERADGGLDFTMRVAITPEVVRWVRGWGPDVIVLGPHSLGKILKEGWGRSTELHPHIRI